MNSTIPIFFKQRIIRKTYEYLRFITEDQLKELVQLIYENKRQKLERQIQILNDELDEHINNKSPEDYFRQQMTSDNLMTVSMDRFSKECLNLDDDGVRHVAKISSCEKLVNEASESKHLFSKIYTFL